MMLLMLPMSICAEYEALTVTSGTGTAEDPYSGSLRMQAHEIPSEFYVELGTEISIGLSLGPTLENFSVDSGFGLEIKPRSGFDVDSLVGIASAIGSCTVYKTSGVAMSLGVETMSAGYTPFFTIHIVKSVEELIFESDPSSGVIEYIET